MMHWEYKLGTFVNDALFSNLDKSRPLSMGWEITILHGWG